MQNLLSPISFYDVVFVFLTLSFKNNGPLCLERGSDITKKKESVGGKKLGRNIKKHLKVKRTDITSNEKCL